MGEMADDLINQMLDDGHFFICRRSRWMQPPPTCKRCGSTAVHWVQKNERWSLVDSQGALHVCPQDQPSPEGFENEPIS